MPPPRARIYTYTERAPQRPTDVARDLYGPTWRWRGGLERLESRRLAAKLPCHPDATDMFCSSKFMTSPPGGESSSSCDDMAQPTTGCGVDQPLADEIIQVSVRGAAHRTHAPRLKRSDTIAGLKDMVQRMGYDLGVDRLCHLGGAPLPLNDCLTLAECGMHAKSSLQVLGRLRGGVEVTLFGQQHSLGDTGHLNFEGKDLGPVEVKEVATFLASPESANIREIIRRLTLGGNKITDVGKDLSGLKALCKVLPILRNPISLDLANCALRFDEMKLVARAIKVGAMVTSLNCLYNPLGEGLQTITKVFEETSMLRTLCGFEEGITKIDWSNSGNGPTNVALLAAELKAKRAAAMLTSITLDGQPLSGSTPGKHPDSGRESFENFGVEQADANIFGFKLLCEALASSRIEIISMKNCYLGWHALRLLADAIKFMAVLNSLTVDSTGDMDSQKTYTLTAAEDKIDLSSKNLGSADVALVVAWLQRPEVRAALNSLTVDSTGDTKDRGEWNNRGPKSYTLTVGEEKIDLHLKNLGSADVALVVAWLQRPEVSAAIARLSLSRNFITSSTRLGYRDAKYDNDLSGLISLCDALLALKNPIELDLSNCGMSVNGVNLVAKAIFTGVEMTSLSLAKNPLYLEGIQALCQGLCASHSKLRSLDVAECVVGPKGLKEIVTYLASDAGAVVARLILDENPLTGGRSLSNFDTDITGITDLCDTLKTSSVTELGVAKCRLGPGSLGKLAEYVREDEAVVTSMNCLNNPLGEGVHTIIKVFEETPRIRTLCGLAGGDERIDWSDSSKGAADVALLAAEIKASRAAAASAEVVILDGNPIGIPAAIVKPGAVTGVAIKKGVFAAVDGRFGEVTMNPVRRFCDAEVKLRWLDGSESKYTKVDKLASAVSSRTDLIENSHVRSLGEALSSSKVHTYGLA
eukprot:COSAG02_NODE_7058_length_3205_cov_1.679652_2_plen_923_part_01